MTGKAKSRSSRSRFHLFPPTRIASLAREIPTGVQAFFELPLNSDLEVSLAELSEGRAAAKLRTGGLRPDAFPSATALSTFLASCARARVPFKATAGLHHALRGQYRVTHEPSSLSTTMHGFLNVALAAAFIQTDKLATEETVDLLEESSADAFQFLEDGIAWNGRTLSLQDLEEVRRSFFLSFGSCLLQEPLEELTKLEVL